MKRMLSILLAITLLIASGCGGQSGSSVPSDNTHPQNAGSTAVLPGDASGAEENAENTDAAAPKDSDYNPTVTGFKLGDTMADFTISTYDGQSVTLSEVLAEKDVVLINIFATWCGPCKSEFPFMEAAYKQFKDQVEVIALSGDSSDTTGKIRDLATSLGLTFPVGQDSAGICRNFGISAFPTTILLDRFGTIVYTHVGSFPDTSSFVQLYEFLLSENYTESIVLQKIPPEMPHLELLDTNVISNALSDQSIIFENTPDQYNWPMSVAEMDGREVLVSSNQGKDRSSSAVQATVSATAGDVFAFDFKLSSEVGFDFFQLTVNGETVKVFSGGKGWTSFAYEFSTDGEYLIELAYVKDDAIDSGEDTLWLDHARILSGDDAAAALASNPSYPTAEDTYFHITNDDVTRVVFDDPYGIVYKIFGCPYEAYLLNGLEVDCVFGLADGVDPEAAVCYDSHGFAYVLASIVSDDGYAASFSVDSLDTTGKGYTYVVLDTDVRSDGEKLPIVFFADVAGLEKFTKTFAAGQWHDAEEWESQQGEENQKPQGDVVYTIRCVDETGERVSGVTLQVCNDSTCSVYISDANGECVLTLPCDEYEIHILKAPEGCTFDPDVIVTAPVEGGEITISLKKT